MIIPLQTDLGRRVVYPPNSEAGGAIRIYHPEKVL